MEDKLSQHQRFHLLCRDLPYLPPRVTVTPAWGYLWLLSKLVAMATSVCIFVDKPAKFKLLRQILLFFAILMFIQISIYDHT